MAWSGYLGQFLASGSGFELVGCLVAQGAVQPGAVVPGDVVDDRVAGRSVGGPVLRPMCLIAVSSLRALMSHGR